MNSKPSLVYLNNLNEGAKTYALWLLGNPVNCIYFCLCNPKSKAPYGCTDELLLCKESNIGVLLGFNDNG